MPVEQFDTALPSTTPSAKFVCSPTEVNVHKNLIFTMPTKSGNSIGSGCPMHGIYSYIFSLYHANIGHNKILAMDIDMEDHPPIAQRHYTLPLKYT